jgi:hypothetical protein
MLEITTLTDIQTEKVEFLTEPYIPRGKITLISGDPSVGKSTLASAIAASVTTGKPLPWDLERGDVEPGNVLYQTTEDGYGDTVRPRLERLGADISRVHRINDSVHPLSLDDPRIEQAIAEKNAKMLLLDPLTSYVGTGDINSSGSIRPALTNLAMVAERTGCAVICISFLCKKGGKSQYRTFGSIDVLAIARSALTVGHYPGDDEIRVFVNSKNNLRLPGKPQSFGFDDKSGIVWLGECDITIDELLDGELDEKKRNKAASQIENAKKLIAATLSGGAVSATEIQLKADGAGISKSTLDRAKSALGVKSIKQGDNWVWQLSDAE